MSKPNNSQGILLMLWASISFAIMAAATKWLGGALPASEIVFIRSALSTAVLVFMLRSRRDTDWIGKQPMILAARGIIGFAALTCYFWCIPFIHLGTAVMLNYTSPIFAVLISFIFLKERSSLTVKLLTACAFFGVYLVTSPQMDHQPAALLAGLASGLLAGIVHLLIRQSHGEKEPPLLIIFYFTVICTLGSVLLKPFSSWPMPNFEQWVALLVITASSFMGQLGLTYSLQKAPISVVSVFGYLTPVIGLIIGYLFWGEIPGVAGITGSIVLILCGSVLYKKQA